MAKYIELEVSLREIRPRIWRRFLLAAGSTFEDLHRAIQAAFGWENCHLWEFMADRRGEPLAGPPCDDSMGGRSEAPNASRVRLSSFFKPGGAAKCLYVYDFGDDWEHQVVAKRHVESADRFRRRLLAGARSGPPEDCGGVPGYYGCCEFVETGKHPCHDDAEDFGEWLDDWRPDDFDLEKAREDFDLD